MRKASFFLFIHINSSDYESAFQEDYVKQQNEERNESRVPSVMRLSENRTLKKKKKDVFWRPQSALR